MLSSSSYTQQKKEPLRFKGRRRPGGRLMIVDDDDDEEEEEDGERNTTRANENIAFIHGNSEFASDWKQFSRDCVTSDVKNARSLALTERILQKNAAEYTVWWFRLRCVKYMFGECRAAEERRMEETKREARANRFSATGRKPWRTDVDRKEKIKHLVTSEEEKDRFRKEMIDLGVDETRIDEARKYFRAADSPLIWYSTESLAKFRSGALTRRMLDEDGSNDESVNEGEEEPSTTTSSYWQHATNGDGLKALTNANFQRDHKEYLRKCCEKVREIFPRTKYDILDEEYAFAEAMASKNPKNYQVWNHLRQVASLDDREFLMETSLLDQHSYRRRAFFFQLNVNCDGPYIHHFNDQMCSAAAIRSKYFVENIILFGDDGSKNIHAWTHYVWIAKHIDRNAWLDVFYASEMCVWKDPRNNSAWTARMNYAEFMMKDEKENDSNITKGWNNSEHLKWSVGKKEDANISNVAKMNFNDASIIEEKGFEMIQQETDVDLSSDRVDNETIKNVCRCTGADYSVWCTPGPRFTPEHFLTYDVTVVMEDVLGFDLSSFHVANETDTKEYTYENALRGSEQKHVYAPDSEAAMNYVFGIFALMKKMSPTLDASERVLRRAFLEESEKKIHQMNELTKRDYETRNTLEGRREDLRDTRINSETQFERELNAFRRLKVSAKLSAAQVKAFRKQKDDRGYEELQSTTNPSSTTSKPETTPNANDVSTSALKSLKRCLITDPVRSNFYRNHFVLRR